MRQLIKLFRFRNITWLIMVVVAAYGLYFVKYQVLELQREIVAVEKELKQEVEHLRVVEAEWAYLTRPDRLQQLVKQHTALKPVAGIQVQQVAKLPFPPAEDGGQTSNVLIANY